MAQPHWFTELAIEKLIVDNKKGKPASGVQ
jgi:hypothetical protein